MVSSALALLSCSSDAARRNAALFLDSAMHFRVILDEFDQQVKLLLQPSSRQCSLTFIVEFEFALTSTELRSNTERPQPAPACCLAALLGLVIFLQLALVDAEYDEMLLSCKPGIV